MYAYNNILKTPDAVMPSKDRHRGLAMFYNHADKDRVTSEGVVVLLLSRCIVLLTYARAPSFLFGRVARSSLRPLESLDVKKVYLSGRVHDQRFSLYCSKGGSLLG